MKVKKKTLLLIACAVWSVAGFNILRIGILSYSSYISVINILLSMAVFAVSTIPYFLTIFYKTLLPVPRHPY